MIPDPRTISGMIEMALTAKSNARERTIQGKAGIIGPSNLGFCRQQAVLMTRGVEQTDAGSTMAADWGTALHEWVEDALKTSYPSWLVEADVGRVSHTYPCGAELSGTPDIVVPNMNMVIDIKTVDGFSWVKRKGTSDAHRWQRHHYALGALNAGLLDASHTVYVGNVYIDRSAREKAVYIPSIDEMDPGDTDRINLWLEDVIYAVQNGEDASRDVAAETCERICAYFTACRGGLPDENAGIILDPEIIGAAALYAEYSAAEKAAYVAKEEMKARLQGYSGKAGDMQIRWTYVSGTEQRAGYQRLAVVPLRSG